MSDLETIKNRRFLGDNWILRLQTDIEIYPGIWSREENYVRFYFTTTPGTHVRDHNSYFYLSSKFNYVEIEVLEDVANPIGHFTWQHELTADTAGSPVIHGYLNKSVLLVQGDVHFPILDHARSYTPFMTMKPARYIDFYKHGLQRYLGFHGKN